MSMGIKLFLILVQYWWSSVSQTVSHSIYTSYEVGNLIEFIISAIDAQYSLPEVRKCPFLKNSIVHGVGLCELRKCHIDDTLACDIFKGIVMCDCKRGYLFTQCTGECVRPKQCSKMVKGHAICK